MTTLHQHEPTEILAGYPFSKDFYVLNADISPFNITGATVSAYLAKHPGAFYATITSSDNVFYNYTTFQGSVKNGEEGTYTLELTAEQTNVLEEGKYVYSVTIIDENNEIVSISSPRLAFVVNAMNPDFGTVGPQLNV